MADDSGISRRGFISSSVTGLAAAGFMGLSPGNVFAQEKKEKGEIIYRTLGKTGLKIPIVSMLAKPVDRGVKRLTKGKWGL